MSATVEAPEPATFKFLPGARRLYRCYNCEPPPGRMPGVDFEAPADKPVCPTCGADGNDPITSRLIERLNVIHFEPLHPVARKFARLRGTVGVGHIACDRAKKTGRGDYISTGEPSVVNCPACKESTEFKEATGARLDPRFDVPVRVTGTFDQQLDSGDANVRLAPPMVEATAAGKRAAGAGDEDEPDDAGK